MITEFDMKTHLEMLLKKSINNITKEDLSSITTISLEFTKQTSEEKTISLSNIIEKLPNLTKIVIKNFNINNSVIETLSLLKLECLTFDRCSLSSDLSLEKLLYLNEISFSSCANLNFEFLTKMSKKIKSISIKNPIDEKQIDLSKLINYKQLNKLSLERCVVNNIEYLTNFKNLCTLSLLLSDIEECENSSIFRKLPHLKELYISECYSDSLLLQAILSTVKVYYNLNHLVFEEN